jgi:hypothetical protein
MTPDMGDQLNGDPGPSTSSGEALAMDSRLDAWVATESGIAMMQATTQAHPVAAPTRSRGLHGRYVDKPGDD